MAYFNLNNFLKKLSFTLIKRWGRDNFGRIVCYHKGGGSKVRYIPVNRNNVFNSSGFIVKIETQKDKLGKSLIIFLNGFLTFSPTLENQKVGDIIFSGDLINKSILNPVVVGSTIPVNLLTKNFMINSLELYKGSGFNVSRSKGSYAIVLNKNLDKGEVVILLKSGWRVKISSNCFSTLGQIKINQSVIFKNAGLNRRLGKRPTVRGVAMNPVDHPHGGGNGKTSGGRPSVSPWGRLTKGKPTVKNKVKNIF